VPLLSSGKRKLPLLRLHQERKLRRSPRQECQVCQERESVQLHPRQDQGWPRACRADLCRPEFRVNKEVTQCVDITKVAVATVGASSR
jgi:hypothetical protein